MQDGSNEPETTMNKSAGFISQNISAILREGKLGMEKVNLSFH